MTSENLVCRHGSTSRSTYITVHVFTWNKEITCHVNSVVIDISYFHLKLHTLQLLKIFEIFYFLFKSFVKVELSYVFTINLFTLAENRTEK